jgi:hypothetical protein
MGEGVYSVAVLFVYSGVEVHGDRMDAGSPVVPTRRSVVLFWENEAVPSSRGMCLLLCEVSITIVQWQPA